MKKAGAVKGETEISRSFWAGSCDLRPESAEERRGGEAVHGAGRAAVMGNGRALTGHTVQRLMWDGGAGPAGRYGAAAWGACGKRNVRRGGGSAAQKKAGSPIGLPA